jgi:pantetheine-phosphate adenylyltransferase
MPLPPKPLRREREWVMRVVCPGSFDPVTNGHLDIIGRAAKLHDEVIVAVLRNLAKSSLFTADERVEMLIEVTKEHSNVRVAKFNGLIVDFCRANDVAAIVKGLRAVSDFDYEMQMAQMNYNQAGVETFFMTTNPLYAFLSSSLVKEFARYGGDVAGLVPEPVLRKLIERLTGELPARLADHPGVPAAEATDCQVSSAVRVIARSPGCPLATHASMRATRLGIGRADR